MTSERRTLRWSGAAIGAVTFLAAHAIQVWKWRAWFASAQAPWFLNSGRAVAFTTASLFVAAALTSATTVSRQSDSVVQGSWIGGGGFVAMALVLFVTGAGTIFPIVLATCAAFALASSVAGALAGAGVRSAASHARLG